MNLKYVTLFSMFMRSVAGASRLPAASEFLVEGLEDVVPSYGLFEGSMYAGQLPMDNGKRTGKLMFWMFVPDQPTVPDTIVIWLNGGPGCSSFSAGVVFETSPVTIPLKPAGYCCSDSTDKLEYNKYAWTNATIMLYPEQPIGVGFSHGSPLPVNEDEVSGDFHAFMVNFYKVFDNLASHKLFIVGESYAGIYAPSIARRIYRENQKLENGLTAINLAGVALGNGWVDPKVQGPATIDFAYWHGLIDSRNRKALHAEWEHCMKNDGSHPEPDPFHAFSVPDDCAISEAALMAAGAGVWEGNLDGPNTYDVTTWDPYPILVVDNSTTQLFYNDPRVREALHAPSSIYWSGCVPGAGRRRLSSRHLMADYLWYDQPQSVVPYMAELLDEAGIRMLIYNGDRDLSTCAQGSEMVLDNMEWRGAEKWQKAERGLWVVDNEAAGYGKEHAGLQFVVVYNSGHLVPYNQPSRALDLIKRFLQGSSFIDHEIPSFDRSSYTSTSESKETNVEPTASPSQMVVHHWMLTLLLMVFSFGAGVYFATKRGRRRLTEYESIPDNGIES